MIAEADITSAGVFTKTHGLKGELHALLDIDAEFFEEHPCFIIDVDGIYVPFFAESVRAKGHQATLIKPEGINTEEEAKLFPGKTVYVLKRELADFERQDADSGEEGGYADDFIGFTLLGEQGETLGEITALETSTANALFIVRTPADTTLYVPVAEEFITSINPEERTITMSLPDGLLTLNN